MTTVQKLAVLPVILAFLALWYLWTLANNAFETAERSERALEDLLFKSAVEACRQAGERENKPFDFFAAKKSTIVGLIDLKITVFPYKSTRYSLYADGLYCHFHPIDMSARIHVSDDDD